MSQALIDAVTWKRLAGVKAALADGADPNTMLDGRPLLIVAIWRRAKPIAKALLNAGADVTKLDDKRSTALHWAAETLRDPALAEALISRGAKVNLLDGVEYKKYAPIHYAAINTKFVEVLLAHGAELDLRTGDEKKTALHLLCESTSGNMSDDETESALWFIKRGADINALTKNKYSPLHWASKAGGLKVVKALLAKKAKITNTAQGESPLHLAVSSYNRDTTLWSTLIRAGCDIDQRNKNGATPLMFAQTCNRIEGVKYLLSKGANSKLKDSEGLTALESALKYNQSKLVALLSPRAR